MAAKALCALIPLRAVPLKAAALLKGLNSSLTLTSSKSSQFSQSIEKSSDKVTKIVSYNELHGTLSLCYEILDSLRRRMAGVGDNKVFLSILQVCFVCI